MFFTSSDWFHIMWKRKNTKFNSNFQVNDLICMSDELLENQKRLINPNLQLHLEYNKLA